MTLLTIDRLNLSIRGTPILHDVSLKVAPGQIFGAGKLEELAGLFAAEDVGLVIVDGPVTPFM